jgi:hypothetical protein
MYIHGLGWPGRLREQPPPSWPRRPSDDEAPHSHSRRWKRDPEPFEEHALPELYPGSLVMDDLALDDDDAVTLRVLVRYTVTRLLSLRCAGALRSTRLRMELRVALQHLAMLPEHDWERRTLERLTMLCRAEPGPEIVEAAAIAAEAAAKRSHTRGAFALYRAGYELAVARQWWEAAAQVARGIAQLARLEEAPYSIRLWRRRAAVLERRAIRAAEPGHPARAGTDDAVGGDEPGMTNRT